MLSIIPPIISVIQCTPDNNLPTTIKQQNSIIAKEIKFLRFLFFIRKLNCIIDVGITVVTSIVVDEGYDVSKYPFIKIGR